MTIDLRRNDGTLRGMLVLGRKLLYERFDYIFDLYNNKQTRFLGGYLRLFGSVKYYAVPKRYSFRSSLLTDYIPYKSGGEYLRVYRDLFERARFFPTETHSITEGKLKNTSLLPQHAIGFAPLKKQDRELSWEEIYSKATYIRQLFSKPVLIFGLNKSDFSTFPKDVERGLDNIHMVSNLSFSQELALLASLDLFVGVDASSIRMAELVKVPTFFIEDLSCLERKIFLAKEQLTEFITTQQ